MSSLFERLRGRREPTSAEIAKERLKLVLVTDRSDLSPDKLGEMQREIIDVIRRYIPINDADVLIKLEQRDRKNYLVADIPLYRDHTYQVAAGDEAALMASLANPPKTPETKETENPEDSDSADAGAAETEPDDAESQESKDD